MEGGPLTMLLVSGSAQALRVHVLPGHFTTYAQPASNSKLVDEIDLREAEGKPVARWPRPGDRLDTRACRTGSVLSDEAICPGWWSVKGEAAWATARLGSDPTADMIWDTNPASRVTSPI